MKLRYAPGGALSIGSPPTEEGRDSDEVLHPVTLTRDLWVMETEVTQGLWSEVMEGNPSFFTACGEGCPVERVSWYDSLYFANRLSERSHLPSCYTLSDCRGMPGSGCAEDQDWCHGDYVCEQVDFAGLDCGGYRLPTEAEWESFARAGTEAPTWQGGFETLGLNDAPALGTLAWYGGNSTVDYSPAWECDDWPERERDGLTCGTHPVGQKEPNPWGLADPLGNVWEWVWDRYGDYPTEAAVDPLGPAEGPERTRRGCAWASIARHCRAADRNRETPSDRDRNWGLRLVRTAVGSTADG